MPVILEINANAAAFAEKWKRKDCKNLIYIVADSGIGCGIVINGEVYKGSHFQSGIVGHTIIDINGEKCRCGKYGCLETFVSIPKIQENIIKRLKLADEREISLFQNNTDQVSLNDILVAFKQNSIITRQTINEAGQYLGVGIANLINILDPEKIVIGGRLSAFGDELIAPMRTVIDRQVIANKSKLVKVVRTEVEEGIVIGTAALVFNNILNNASN